MRINTSGFRALAANTAITILVCAAAARFAPAASNAGGTVPPPDLLSQLKKKYLRPTGVTFPSDNKWTSEREALGRTLFFDPRLSGSKFISCATCHNPGFGWSDGLQTGIGDGMKSLPRHTPTILNAAFGDLMFWDGRADSLEEQAVGPIKSAAEMNLPLDKLVERVSSVPGYKPLFERAYPGEPITEKSIAKAIATFERTVVSPPSSFDAWIRGDERAISAEAKHGFELFNSKAGCAQCHSGWNFTDSGFHDIGVKDDDLGRGALLKIEAMQHAFKTPTLRNLKLRAPYMHNGSEPTLEDVIAFYDAGGRAQRASLAPELRPLHLTASEKSDLLEFLHTLTSDDKPVQIPTLPR